MSRKMRGYMQNLSLCCVLYLLVVSCVLANDDAQVNSNTVLHVKYTMSEKINPLYKERTLYLYQLFQLALEKSGEPYQLEVVHIPTSLHQSRSIKLIQKGFYDAHWFTTNKTIEQALRPVRIPLLKGLIGLRLMFIHKDNPDLLSDIKNVNDLKKMTAGQGINWPDTQLLLHHRFTVGQAISTDGLLKMLAAKRIEYFPRSILEIGSEKEAIEDMPIIIDEHIALSYPLAVYFFVKKENKRLHDVLEKGLNIAIADGSFDRLFMAFANDYLIKSNMKNRKVFMLNNPYMSADTPITRKALWYTGH